MGRGGDQGPYRRGGNQGGGTFALSWRRRLGVFGGGQSEEECGDGERRLVNTMLLLVPD